ncbi:MAG: PilN domain-containing protein [Rhodothalassiaceae bacterium]
MTIARSFAPGAIGLMRGSLWHAGLPGQVAWRLERLLLWLVTGLIDQPPATKDPGSDGAKLAHPPTDAVLSFSFVHPIEGLASLDDAVALEIERRTPFPADAVAAAYEVAPQGRGVSCTVALTHADLLSQSQEDLAVLPADGQAFYLPLRADSRYWRRRRRRLLSRTALVALVLCLCLGALWSPVWVAERRTEALAPALGAAQQALADQRQARQADQAALAARQRLSQLRADHPSALELLRLLTDALDDSTYLTELRYSGGKLFLRGESQSAATVLEALERIGPFKEVQFVSPVAVAADRRETFQISLIYQAGQADGS